MKMLVTKLAIATSIASPSPGVPPGHHVAAPDRRAMHCNGGLEGFT